MAAAVYLIVRTPPGQNNKGNSGIPWGLFVVPEAEWDALGRRLRDRGRARVVADVGGGARPCELVDDLARLAAEATVVGVGPGPELLEFVSAAGDDAFLRALRRWSARKGPSLREVVAAVPRAFLSALSFWDRGCARLVCKAWALALDAEEAWADIGPAERARALAAVLFRGSLEAAEWTAGVLPLTDGELYCYYEEVLRGACLGGMGTLRWAESRCGSYAALIGEYAVRDLMFEVGAEVEDPIPVLEWLGWETGVDLIDLETGVDILKVACEAGNLDLAEWGVSKYGLAALDLCAAFEAACASGSTHVLQWLADRCGLAEALPQMEVSVDSLVADAEESGHDGVAEWLSSAFPGSA